MERSKDMEDLLQPTEVIEFDEEKYQKNINEHDYSQKETNLKGSEDNDVNN